MGDPVALTYYDEIAAYLIHQPTISFRLQTGKIADWQCNTTKNPSTRLRVQFVDLDVRYEWLANMNNALGRPAPRISVRLSVALPGKPSIINLHSG